MIEITKNLKIFFFAFILSLPFWWGFNVFQENLEDFLFWTKMSADPNLLMAQVWQENNLAELKPIRNPQVEDLQLDAEASISVFIDQEGLARVLFEKNGEKQLPIASLTKLMTANVVLEYYDIHIPEIAHLLYPLLISSDNTAAQELAKMVFSESDFVGLMNFEAEKLSLKNTNFFNPTGLDPENEADSPNYSTVQDLAKLAKYLTENNPLIWEISRIQAFEDVITTNELLEEFPGIIGGKTGWTERAKGCLLIILESPNSRGKIINVILGSSDRFEDMRKLVNWIESSYKW